MAIRLLESRLEQLSVNDENEPVNGGAVYQKSKVSAREWVNDLCLQFTS